MSVLTVFVYLGGMATISLITIYLPRLYALIGVLWAFVGLTAVYTSLPAASAFCVAVGAGFLYCAYAERRKRIAGAVQ